MFSYQDFYACTLSTIIGYRIVHDPNRGALTPFHSVPRVIIIDWWLEPELSPSAFVLSAHDSAS